MELTDVGLFPDPPRRLPRETHTAVFGALPTRLARELDKPAVAALVTKLLDRGWRSGQLAARVGGCPAAANPALGLRVLLTALQGEPTPEQRAAAERARRAASTPDPPAAASAQVKARYLAQIRRELGLAAAPPRPPAVRLRPPCALCGGASGFFVTRQVRLCTSCVQLLEGGHARLVAAG